MEKNNIISKSAYLIYLQCPKYLWHHINDRENIPEADLRARFNFKASHFTGSLAKKCFPDGVQIDTERGKQQDNLKTLKLMNLRKPLFGAGFLCKNACFFNGQDYGIYARADILVPAENELAGFGQHYGESVILPGDACPDADTASLQDGFAESDINRSEKNAGPGEEGWDIVEVKITTGVKKINIYEIAFQRHCYRAAGINIRNCYVMNINSDYILNGEINPFELFKITEITASIEKLNLDIEKDIENIAEIISGECPPKVNPGKFCSKPFNCPLKKNCWESVSNKNILFLYSINHKMIKRLNESDIGDISDIPLDFSGINEKQRVQIENTKNGTKYIDKEAISDFLKQINYPVFFLDFETFASPIPLIENTRPYQSIPFQFSLHVLRKLKGDLEHHFFLADGISDPRPALLASLREWFGFGKSNKSFRGSVIVYDESFEHSILRDLVVFDTGHASWLFKIAARIVDLYNPFKNFYYYNSIQKGSASIKKVLPALTEKSYNEMAISNGDIAAISFLEGSNLWKEATLGISQSTYGIKNTPDVNIGQNSGENVRPNTFKNEFTAQNTDEVRVNLLEYCKLDTESLYYIMLALEKLII